jgi:H+/Cl- antiporter ClcA
MKPELEARLKYTGIIACLALLLFWFAPWVEWDEPQMFGSGTDTIYQSGEHIGGRAYLILLAALAQAGFGWFRHYGIAALVSLFGLALCGLYLIDVWHGLRYGLSCLTGIFAGLSGYYIWMITTAKKFQR